MFLQTLLRSILRLICSFYSREKFHFVGYYRSKTSFLFNWFNVRSRSYFSSDLDVTECG